MKLLATGIADSPHIAAFDDLVKARMEALPTDAVLVYLVDNVPADALYWLAKQFDVLGVRGWALTNTEQQRRDLIKRAIELAKYKGTPWSIKEALRTIGFDNVIIDERLTDFVLLHNAVAEHTGVFRHGTGHWAMFSVIIDIAGFGGVLDPQRMELARELVLEYKNARSWLVDISYGLFDEETIGVTDEMDEFLLDLTIDESVRTGLFFDATATHNGVAQNDGDILEITVHT